MNSSPNDEKRSVCAPAVPYFVAVALGILFDFEARPGVVFWAVFLCVSVAAVFGEVAFSWIQTAKRGKVASEISPSNIATNEKNGVARCGSSVCLVDSAVRSEKNAISKRSDASDETDSAFWTRWLAKNLDESDVVRRDDLENSGWNAALSRYLRLRRADVSNASPPKNAANSRVEIASRIERVPGGDRETREIADVFARLDFEGFSSVFPFVDDAAAIAGRDRSADVATNAAPDWRELRRFFCFYRTQSVDFVRRTIRAAARRSVWRSVWALAAVGALAGFRHDAYFNEFPENEIGLVVPATGTAATLELRLIKTPILYRSEKPTNPLFNETETTTFVAKTLRAKNRGVWEEFSGKVAVSVAGDATFLKIGDAVRVAGRLAPPLKSGNPGEFDRRYFYRSQRILTTLAANDVASVERLTETEFSPSFRVARAFETIRLRAAKTLRRELSPRNAAVACGMTLGLRNEIDDETNEAFLKTGTIHLLSISGLHLALIVGAFCGVLRFCGLSERWTSVATLALVVFYLGLTDLRTPVLRAGILVVVICGAVLTRRRALSLNSLTTAAIALLFWNPCELFQLGAQLSFLATGTFLWTSRSSLLDRANSATSRRRAILERGRLREKTAKSPRATTNDGTSNARGAETESRASRRLRSVRSAIRRGGRSFAAKYWSLTKTGAAIWCVGTPLILSSTNLFASVAIVANVAIWLPAAFALLSALALGAFGMIGAPDWALAPWSAATNVAFDAFLRVLDLASRPKFGGFRVPGLANWALWTFYLPLIFGTLFPNRRPSRRTLTRALALWLAAILVVDVGERWNVWRRDVFRADVLSVGHGVAILLFFPDGRTALVDCGSISNAERVGDLVAKNLWNAGKNRLDLVLLSHADYDHYAGLESLDDSICVERVGVSPAMFQKDNEELTALKAALTRRKTPIETIAGGETLARFGFPELSLLHPTPGGDSAIGAESNENSLVVALERRGRLLLFPGDLDAPNAPFLATPPVRFDAILAPHHGGKSENYRELFNWTNPTWVVVSGGSFQRNVASENLLRDEGRRVLHTLDDGCVRFEIERDLRKDENALGMLRVRTFRSERWVENDDVIR